MSIENRNLNVDSTKKLQMVANLKKFDNRYKNREQELSKGSKFMVLLKNQIYRGYGQLQQLLNAYMSDPRHGTLSDVDISFVLGSPAGIYGRFFELLIEYIVLLKRNSCKGFNESKFAFERIDEHFEEYDRLVKDTNRIIKSRNLIFIEDPQEMFKTYVIMALEISYWRFWDININPKNIDNNLRISNFYLPGSAKILYTNYRYLIESLKADIKLINGIKPFVFQRLKNPVFEDLFNTDNEIMFNLKYYTYNQQIKTNNQIREFDIVVFKNNEEDKPIVKRIYELKFNSRHADEYIEDIKQHATDGSITIYKYLTDISFRYSYLETKYTIFNFWNQYTKTI
jgi:hypothetical protein